MSALHIDAALIEREIAALIDACPEMAEDEQLRADMIEGETDAHGLLSRIIRAALWEAAQQDAIKALAATYGKRRDASAKREEALRAMAFRLMQAADLRKVPLPEATLSIARVAPSVIVEDPDALPAELTRTKVEPDKKAIKERLDAGEIVPGATLSNGGERLNVRVA
ncbi:hypothetical protein GCM10008171_32670 [Methylopila jiangsuensis]|uniref:Siphovirus Gp157 family protein n=1 Tax=Methylopila jiangsuensis TaxID=586230 RepID=A0A9W6N553_9HYPH|nr:siphovirus Gp157 family protein [Methylopila jiangsuensis]MDR6284598.1 hypothetical protein [Methylopila jiangsuensis]GLK78013.1 hypothetical protein GCM10008171_32670 [Methylopila jiangsuensis]